MPRHLQRLQGTGSALGGRILLFAAACAPSPCAA
jgi:hypothetical protein